HAHLGDRPELARGLLCQARDSLRRWNMPEENYTCARPSYGRRKLVHALALALLASLSGCSGCLNATVGASDSVHSAFDNALAQLSQSSTSWQATLMQLENNLVKHGQQTLANQVQSVIDRGLAAAAVEAKCGADFLKARLKEEIQAIEAHAHNQK